MLVEIKCVEAFPSVCSCWYFSGKSPFGFAEENQLLDDGSLDQTVPNMNSPSRGSPSSQSGLERIERFSRKVFVGGLPPDIDEGRQRRSHQGFNLPNCI